MKCIWVGTGKYDRVLFNMIFMNLVLEVSEVSGSLNKSRISSMSKLQAKLQIQFNQASDVTWFDKLKKFFSWEIDWWHVTLNLLPHSPLSPYLHIYRIFKFNILLWQKKIPKKFRCISQSLIQTVIYYADKKALNCKQFHFQERLQNEKKILYK